MSVTTLRSTSARQSGLASILVAAAVQGCALYALHLSIKLRVWPATSNGMLLGLYAAAVFAPTSLQLLAAYARQVLTWALVAIVALLFFYFGWFHGHRALDFGAGALMLAPLGAFPLAFELLLLWLVVLPFVQIRLAEGAWRPHYRKLFSFSWRNHLTLAEAALFTLLFRALLSLWQILFHLLGIDVFRTLFDDARFSYPVTALAFGVALYLIGSLEQWTAVVLDQLLSVLKWLAVLAAAILLLFTLTLLFKLPHLIFAGERAIGAAWLLWLVAVVVLFWNAAFRDGSLARPYPAVLGTALRIVTPLLLIVALTAAYALAVRTRHYGLTVERFWGLVAATFAVVYAVGYTTAALRGGSWMASIAPVNVAAALALVILIVSTLTPLLSPYRLAADSQYRMALRWQDGRGVGPDVLRTPFYYLRHDTGAYGNEKLALLARLTGPGSSRTRQLAVAALAQPLARAAQVVGPLPPPNFDEKLAHLPVYPANRDIPTALRAVIRRDLDASGVHPMAVANAASDWAGLYANLDGGSQDQFVLLMGPMARIYQLVGAGWNPVGSMFSPGGAASANLREHLAAGNVTVVPRRWADLNIAGHLYRFVDPIR